ncbi:MAG TPA: glycosyltransferase family 4 protein [Nostoc sp.]|uniref:glycosyltransferase family 4 protein n=1 Tax=Nostoc sp. TaxID=1180 RepID=UPI002D32A4E4|nr:glycosyltransferase family 4 protein [Nostoc sp.]HYX18494.1 glycosyltransferase family 4 protein [Nostoc sp.]
MSDVNLSIVHHGNAGNVRQAALAFAESSLLYELITTLAYNPNAPIWGYLDLLPSQLKIFILNELSKRTWTVKDKKISTYPWYEILRLFLLRTQLNKFYGLTTEQIGNWGFVLLDRQVALHHLRNLSAIYSYEDIAAITFEKAKKNGIYCLYDLPIPFYQTTRRIMQEEAERFPSLKHGIQAINEPDWKLKRKEREVELADHIFVASSVTQKSLTNAGINPNNISVIPYGAPIDTFQPQPKSDNCFRVMFSGRFSPLKGIHYLLQAWQGLKFKNAQLVFIGQNGFPQGWLEQQYSSLYHHIPSVSHFLLNQYYSQASILVLPSLIDGFGLVVVEAMSCGIPVIVTVNTGASDIITNGVEGFIIPIRDVEALKEKLEWCYYHPQELAEMGRAARRKAEQLNWDVYRQRLTNKVRSLLKV